MSPGVCISAVIKRQQLSPGPDLHPDRPPGLNILLHVCPCNSSGAKPTRGIIELNCNALIISGLHVTRDCSPVMHFLLFMFPKPNAHQKGTIFLYKCVLFMNYVKYRTR